MPTKEQHTKKAECNKKFQAEISKGTLSDAYRCWQIIVLYYEAVHVIDKTLHCAGHPDANNHTERKELLKDTSYDLFLEYLTLENMSRNARYEFMQFTDNDVSDAKSILYRLNQIAYRERKKYDKAN